MDRIPEIRKKYREATTLDRKSLLERFRAWNWVLYWKQHRFKRLLKWLTEIFKKLTGGGK
jgi:hypothetical protein